ncbi:hypothetical protein L195_g051297, partial [Trifolium pratense]
VKLALDSATDEFVWRPYVRYSDNRGMFYPNDEIWIPFKKDLVDDQMLSFVISLRVSELVGFDSIEQYLPHRVTMQFARLFEADVTTRYANWWKQSILGRGDFVQNIVRKKRNPGSRKHRPFVGNGNGSDDGSKPKTRKVDEFYADVHHENSVPDCSQMTKHNTVIPSMYVEDSNHVSKDYIELSVWSLEEGFKDANGSKEAEISSDRVYISETQGKSCNYAIRNKVSSLNKVTAAQHDVQFLSDNVAQVQE